MLKIIISGCSGHMGRVVESICAADPAVQVAAGFDVLGSSDREFPVYSSPSQDFARRTGTPLVLATTGYTPEQVAQIGAAALEVPIFRSANMSLGINVLLELVKKAASVLGDSYDIEIVERHHRRKVDAPSGTALMIADAAASACGHESEYVFERHSVRQPRDKKEIGISAVRGGTIVGEHEIIFAGHDEIMEIRHTALSREIFAQGAVEAAKFMATVKTPGLYDMSQLVK